MTTEGIQTIVMFSLPCFSDHVQSLNLLLKCVISNNKPRDNSAKEKSKRSCKVRSVVQNVEIV